ncbi:MAG: 3,4-dihydroxy-2-butanone-4-phosphate synthase [Phycisphaeraceae bacterium]|nr:3,4-dihydroxy-2-butanone-4-phosphate synthase [Phycisphaeraceae bacterium]
MPFSPIPDILADLRAGKMIVLTDDERRENEGDLVLPAQFITPEAITFLLTVARGYLCLSLTEADCDRLDLHPQAAVNTTVRGTAFTVSIDGHPRHGFTTGVSAKERARCIRMAIDPDSRPDDFVRPGHINPLRSRDGGVLVRTGQTEGSIDLCRMAGLTPAAAIIEIMRDDGEMARLPDLEALCAKHDLKLCSVAQVIEHRLARESLVKRLAPAGGVPLRSKWGGEFTLMAFESLVDPLPHVVLAAGGVGALLDTSGLASPDDDRPTLVRVHRRHTLGDVFGDLDSSPEGPTGDTLHASMRAIQAEGRGAVVYLRPETVGDGLLQRLNSLRRTDDPGPGANDPHLTAAASNAVPPMVREIGVGSQILRNLGLRNLRLLTNHATDWPGLDAFGLRIVERVPIG